MAWLAVQLPPPHAIIAGDGTYPLLSNDRTLVHYQLCLGWNQGAGRIQCSGSSSDGKRICFDTLDKHSPVNWKKKYAALPSVVIKEFENKFKDSKKSFFFFFFCIFVTLFSVNINTWPAKFQMFAIELGSEIQLKNLIMSLWWTFTTPLLAGWNIPPFLSPPQSYPYPCGSPSIAPKVVMMDYVAHLNAFFPSSYQIKFTNSELVLCHGTC